MSDEKLTKHQSRSLHRIKQQRGSDWFRADGGGWFGIRRPEYTCEILHRKGRLERRVNGGPRPSALYWEYRVIEPKQERDA